MTNRTKMEVISQTHDEGTLHCERRLKLLVLAVEPFQDMLEGDSAPRRIFHFCKNMELSSSLLEQGAVIPHSFTIP